MKQIAVFLAEGFEEIEGLTVTDLLRRAGVTVTNVSVTGEKTVHGSHGIGVEADALFEEMEFEGMDMLVLPGGMPGTGNRDSIRIEADRAPVRKGKGRRNRAWSSLLLKSTGNIEVTMLY